MSAVQNNLKQYALFIQKLRAFLVDRGVTEVQTKHLVPFENPDPQVQAIQVDSQYLHSSPEFAMKRLLTQGSGDIFQLCHVWRQEEEGKWHRDEFIMLEWYRVGWSLEKLINEVIELVSEWRIFTVNRISYVDLFKRFLKIDPVNDSCEQMLRILSLEETCDWSQDILLDYAYSTKIEPTLQGLWVIEDYPASQAALARLKPEDSSLALRFEIVINGVEIANGFDELSCRKTQRLRFINQNKIRRSRGLPEIPINELWLNSLDHLPACSGVALGVDRLYALSHGLPMAGLATC
ncbi:MAG TPA: amino acid--tRNA ligase-related protein [Gammaproteobacteria bacterium]|nr:amino acid--tRNA ligase-related protein [Gammaproteobacteria bacterium]